MVAERVSSIELPLPKTFEELPKDWRAVEFRPEIARQRFRLISKIAQVLTIVMTSTLSVVAILVRSAIGFVLVFTGGGLLVAFALWMARLGIDVAEGGIRVRRMPRKVSIPWERLEVGCRRIPNGLVALFVRDSAGRRWVQVPFLMATGVVIDGVPSDDCGPVKDLYEQLSWLSSVAVSDQAPNGEHP